MAGTVLAVVSLAITGCGSSGPDEGACKAAMKAQYAKAMNDPSAPPASEPPACKGIPAATLQQIAAQIMASSGLPSPAAS